MTKALFDPTPERKITQNRFFIKDTRQKPLAFSWWTPDCTVGDGCTAAQAAVVLQNNFSQPTGTLELFAFRLHADGSLEFKGHLDTSGGAVSGTVAFTLPGANTGEVDFLLPNDQFWHTTITTDDGTTFFLALVFIEATTGDVTITWPVS